MPLAPSEQMYERSAIVLERYFEKVFGFNKENNLKTNYENVTIDYNISSGCCTIYVNVNNANL